MKNIILITLMAIFTTTALAQNNAEDPDLQYGTELLKSGTPAPDFSLNDISGKPIKMSALRGRQVVLTFWASWCPDCRAEVPLLKDMEAASDPRRIVFVSVSFDRTFEAFKAYANEQNMGGILLYDPAGKKDSSVGAAYHIKWIPSLYLIDAEGKVVLGTVVADKIAKAIGYGETESAGGVCGEEGCTR